MMRSLSIIATRWNQFQSLLGWRVGLLLLALVAWGVVASLHVVSSPAHAQEAGEDETLVDEPVGGAPVAPASAANDSPGTSGSRTTVFSRLMDAGITWLLIFFLLSLVMVFFIIEHAMTIRKGKIMPEYVVTELEQKIARGEINQAIEFCHQPENYSLAGEVILAGLERFVGSDFGFAEYKTAVEEEGEDQTSRLYRKTEVLGVIGAIAPMLGLTGTVLGMIIAFNAIAEAGGMAKPEELAGGIGQALITTLLGLLIAIPAMISFSFFRNKIDSLVAEVGKRVERILMPLGRKR